MPSDNPVQDAERRIRRCKSWSFYPSNIWWEGPSSSIKASAEPDWYGVQKKQGKSYWHDKSRKSIFGPAQETVKNPYPDWTTTVVNRKPRFNAKDEQRPTNADTLPDYYEVRHRNQLTKSTSSNFLTFEKKGRRDWQGRFQVGKAFGKDYTRAGAMLPRVC